MFFFSTNEVVERRFRIYSFYLLLIENNFFPVRLVYMFLEVPNYFHPMAEWILIFVNTYFQELGFDHGR